MANSRILYLSLALGLVVLSISGCTKRTNFYRPIGEYPDSKIWAHGVSWVWSGREAEAHFEGMEVDLNYSEYQDQLFMGHELYDTIRGLTFEAWLDSLYHPDSNYYWLDMKNLTPENASRISHHILLAARRHNIKQHVMVESEDLRALQIVKDSGLRVIFWVENNWWTGSSNKHWANKLRQQIDSLHPDALSGDYHMFPLLADSFPTENIHIWDTPREYNDSNVAHSRLIAQHPSVRVVLVDYPEPFDNE
ncbi:MAG: hypothetical protein IKG81_10210 [Bacteroidales bacterium]|nr:hypothetical protein [Bacteroidales bacterium]